MLNGSTTSDWNINSTEFLSEKKLGSPAFFTIDITIDDKNSSQYILEVCVIDYSCLIINYDVISTFKAGPVWTDPS